MHSIIFIDLINQIFPRLYLQSCRKPNVGKTFLYGTLLDVEIYEQGFDV